MSDGSVWPFDFVHEEFPNPSMEKTVTDVEMRLRCFILCPFTPSERAEALRETVIASGRKAEAKIIRNMILSKSSSD